MYMHHECNAVQKVTLAIEIEITMYRQEKTESDYRDKIRAANINAPILLLLSAVTIRSSLLLAIVGLSGFSRGFPSSQPTLTAPTAPSQGMFDTAKAAEATIEGEGQVKSLDNHT